MAAFKKLEVGKLYQNWDNSYPMLYDTLKSAKQAKSKRFPSSLLGPEAGGGSLASGVAYFGRELKCNIALIPNNQTPFMVVAKANDGKQYQVVCGDKIGWLVMSIKDLFIKELK